MEKSGIEVFSPRGKVAKNFNVQGRREGIKRLCSKVSRGFKDKSLSCMEIGCAVPNRVNMTTAFAFSAAKKARHPPGSRIKIFSDVNHLLNALIRLLNLETFRAAVFGCTIPFCAARMTNGSATRKAAAAAPWSPAAIASSTLRT